MKILKPDVVLRVVLTGAGALAAFSLWLLTSYLPEIVTNLRALMSLAIFLMAGFAVFMVAAGPLPLRRAGQAGLAIAAILAGLMVSASLRYLEVEDFLESGLPILAFLVALVIATPFAIVALAEQTRWNDYESLFNQAWNIFVRSMVALVFVGLVWAVIFLSDQLLQLVGLTVIGDILRQELAPYLITGAALGLALAVVHEMSDYVAPFLVLRLLRLLVPPVLAVSLVFLIAIPLRGMTNLSSLFGNLSAGLILMSMAFGALTLVTAALDTGDEDAVAGRGMTIMTRGLALSALALAGLAVWSVALRVGQYGWTPARLAAMTGAALLLAYGLAYAFAVVRGAGWMARIRRANVHLALLTLALALLWLTPVLNAERISAKSQLARLVAGKVSAEKVDLWAIGRDWGQPGAAVLARMGDLNLPDQAVLDARIARLASAEYRWDFESTEPVKAPEPLDSARILASVTLVPATTTLPKDYAADQNFLAMVSASCEGAEPTRQPPCLMIAGDFDTLRAGDEFLLVYNRGYSDMDGQITYPTEDGGIEVFDAGTLPTEALGALLSGEFVIEPVPFNRLRVGERSFWQKF